MTFAPSSSLKTLFIIVIVFAAFALTTGKDAVKIEDLAKQLETARQESAKLRQQLEKAHEETKEIIQSENKKLRSEDSKLKREAEEIKKENKKLRRQDEELRKQVEELRQDNSEVKQAFRQRDQNNTLELQNVVRNSFGFRQMDFTAELKKMMNKQIKEYLDENKMCVMGYITEKSKYNTYTKDRKIEFGHTFQRIPAFAAALSVENFVNIENRAMAGVWNFRVTNSSALVSIEGNHLDHMYINWVACL